MDGLVYNVYAICGGALEEEEAFDLIDDAIVAYGALCASCEGCEVTLLDTFFGNILMQTREG